MPCRVLSQVDCGRNYHALYESLIIDIDDDCNNLLGIELVLHMLRKASLRKIRFIWIRMNLKRSKPDEFDMIVQLLEHIKEMPQIVKTLITGIPKDHFSPSLSQIVQSDFTRT